MRSSIADRRSLRSVVADRPRLGHDRGSPGRGPARLGEPRCDPPPGSTQLTPGTFIYYPERELFIFAPSQTVMGFPSCPGLLDSLFVLFGDGPRPPSR